MIQFRQKVFGKLSPKKVLNWGKNQIKNTNPAMLAVSSIGAGYGLANYRVNKKRQKADEELREEQIKTTKELTDALKKIGLSEKEAKRHSRRIKAAYSRVDPDEEHPYLMEQAKQAVFRKKDK